MDYPSNFNTPAFPAGPSIAVSRFMAIASCVLFVLIIFASGLLLWAVKSNRVDPFIVYVDDFTGQWSVIEHSHENAELEYPALWSVQQSVVGNFLENWFSISENPQENEILWQTCKRSDDCSIEAERAYDDKTCALYCITGEELFSKFIYDVVPIYQSRVSNGETWLIDKTEFQIEPVGKITDNGGTWRINGEIQSSISGNIEIIAFVKVVRNISLYPRTLGYYVADFNAYKIN
ncbi:MAG TPA: hypothetical protein IAC63_01075 [Candidatus Enterousia avicola]|uniref:Uncharacterized protein n=1 Tax=Candidatus Enterousia avicola TaxID=2840787 RepID=A0A9D1MRL0_9PROT|nr:hypothetical protein [Candidatus Enterousia avicola]